MELRLYIDTLVSSLLTKVNGGGYTLLNPSRTFFPTPFICFLYYSFLHSGISFRSGLLFLFIQPEHSIRILLE